MTLTYDEKKKVYDNKRFYIGMLLLAIVVSFIAIYFIFSTQPAETPVQPTVIYRTKPTAPTGFYDAYDN